MTYYEILDQVPEHDRAEVAADARRMCNLTGGQPSACARSAVRSYYANRAAFMAQRQRDHDTDRRNAEMEAERNRRGLTVFDQ